MRSLLSIAIGTALGVLFAIPSVSAQTNGLPDDSPSSGAIIQPREGLESEGLADDPQVGRSALDDDDRLNDDLDRRTDDRGVAGDAPPRNDDLEDTFDEDFDAEPGMDEPGALPGEDDMNDMDGDIH
jgi:hypothetical protein